MEKKHWLWVGLFIIALVILYFLLRKKPATSYNLPALSIPPIYTYNFGPRNINMAMNGLPAVGDQAPSVSGCGCSQASAQLVNGFQALMDYFTSNAKSAFDQYESVVTANVPSIVSQYFNNPTIGLSKESYNVLG